MSFKNSVESGKVSLSLVSGVFLAFSICGGLGKVWVGKVWSTFYNILKESRAWMYFLFINMFGLVSSLSKFSIRVLTAFDAPIFMM